MANVANTRILTRQAEEAIHFRHQHEAPVATESDLALERMGRIQAIEDEADARIASINEERNARIAEINSVNDDIETVKDVTASNASRLNNHIDDLNNPHQVDLGQLGGASVAQLTAIESIVNALAVTIEDMSYLKKADFDEDSGVLTITRHNDTMLTVQIPGLVANVDIDSDYLIITFHGGKEIRLNMRALIPIYKGSIGTHIQIEVNAENEITATLIAGSIDNTRLANMPGGTIKGRTDTSGTPQDLSAEQIRVMLNVEEGACALPDAVSQVEAETGTATSIRSWTALRVRQAINAVTNAISTALNSHIGSRGSAHTNATQSESGFISAADKAKLDGIEDNATAGGDVDFPISVEQGGTGAITAAQALINLGVDATRLFPRAIPANLNDWLPSNIVGAFMGESSTATNAPASGWFRYFGLTHGNPAGHMTILAFEFHSPFRFFVRGRAVTWGAWEQVMTSTSQMNPSFDSLLTRQGLHITTTFPANQVLTIVRQTNADGVEIARRTTTFTATNATVVTAFQAKTFAVDGVTVTTRANTSTVVTTFSNMITV